LQPARERDAILGFRQQVDVIPLHGKMHEPKAEALSRRESL
jgi:hypothetical protein